LSREFATEIDPDEWVRRGVLGFSVIAIVTGAATICLMPIGAPLRAALLLAWLWYGRHDIRRQLIGYRRVSRLHIDALGMVRATDPAGNPVILELESGSLVLQRMAWLRLRFPDGEIYGELLIGDPTRCARWHALQLIWEQQRHAFGRAR